MVYTGCRWGSVAVVVDTEVNKEVVDTEDILTMARSGGEGGVLDRNDFVSENIILIQGR